MKPGFLAPRLYNVENVRMLSLRMSLLAVLLVACASEAEPWRIEVTTSGGIHGRGTGTFVIDASGAYTVTDIHGRTCSFKPSVTSMRRLAAAVTGARPRGWAASYLPDNPCCDRIEWTLTFEQGEVKATTRWVDIPRPMPKDLAAIVEELRLLRVDHVCR